MDRVMELVGQNGQIQGAPRSQAQAVHVYHLSLVTTGVNGDRKFVLGAKVTLGPGYSGMQNGQSRVIVDAGVPDVAQGAGDGRMYGLLKGPRGFPKVFEREA